MALLFMDGFDHYATADITKKWTARSNATIESASGRRGGGAMAISQYQNVTKGLSASYATLIIGFATKLSSLGSSRALLSICDATVQHVWVSVTDAGRIQVSRGSTVLGTGASTLSTNVFYYIEIKATIDDSTGAIDVRINGVSDLSLSNIDTRNGGTATITRVIIGDPASTGSASAWVDDFYICDTSGATNNDFLGDIRVDTIYPDGDGNYTQFTPSTGTAHWSLVDETAPNTTDYNSGANVGDRDSYTYAALSAITSQTIHGVQINAAVLKSDSGSRSLGTMSRLSGTNKDGSGAALSTSQTYISEIQETDPASAAWTESNINSAEFGVKVTA